MHCNEINQLTIDYCQITYNIARATICVYSIMFCFVLCFVVVLLFFVFCFLLFD